MFPLLPSLPDCDPRAVSAHCLSPSVVCTPASAPHPGDAQEAKQRTRHRGLILLSRRQPSLSAAAFPVCPSSLCYSQGVVEGGPSSSCPHCMQQGQHPQLWCPTACARHTNRIPDLASHGAGIAPHRALWSSQRFPHINPSLRLCATKMIKNLRISDHRRKTGPEKAALCPWPYIRLSVPLLSPASSPLQDG